MIKKDIANKICIDAKIPVQQSLLFATKIIEFMKENIKAGQSIFIRGFGNFIVRKKKLGKARHLKTLQSIEIQPGKVVKFKAGFKLKHLDK